MQQGLVEQHERLYLAPPPIILPIACQPATPISVIAEMQRGESIHPRTAFFDKSAQVAGFPACFFAGDSV
jgi:hypothetical protein